MTFRVWGRQYRELARKIVEQRLEHWFVPWASTFGEHEDEAYTLFRNLFYPDDGPYQRFKEREEFVLALCLCASIMEDEESEEEGQL